MAYLKFSRDKRGYEHFYLVQPSNRGKSRPRMLYWFRTPPGVKVGRLPFDLDMRSALETQNPGVVFDWEAIIQTPIPPPVEPERWRERRRVERAERAAENEEFASLAAAVEQPLKSEVMTTVQPAEEIPAVELEELNTAAEPRPASDLTISPGSPESSEPPAVTAQGGPARQGARRRRRRRGRHKPPVQGPEVQGSAPQEPTVQDAGELEKREP